MPPTDQPTELLKRARAGDRQAANQLCLQFFDRVVRLARRLLGNRSLPDAGASDVAQNVLLTFCRRFEAQQFTDLGSGDSLWRLLAHITYRKTAKALRRQQARGGARPSMDDEDKTMATLVAEEPDPAFLVEMIDLRESFLATLSPRLREAVVLRMDEGLSNAEVAARFGISVKRVESMFRTIRSAWQAWSEAGPAEGEATA
jgi:RNA polymerase sigma factor (sigma-70 family)